MTVPVDFAWCAAQTRPDQADSAGAWGQGYATEAAKAALAVALDELRLDEVNSITAVLNAPSRAVMARLGMTLSDEFEHPRISAGSPLRPHVRYLLARPGH